MLVLSRKIGEQIIIGDNIRIVVTGLRGGQVRIGIEAPPTVPIFRDELFPRPADAAAPHGTDTAAKDPAALLTSS
ncbi:MAG: carbon storage regulator [Isosphaeraceae bacterium]|nr:carbon storage regulator [Isosphaeraceae bacterium]